MNGKGWTGIALAVALGAGALAPRAWADAVEEELAGEEKAIEREASRSGSGSQAAALARQSGLAESRIEELRASGKGWGTLSIELSLAKELLKKEPTLYPDLESALAKVRALRGEGLGYGRLAKELGFKLGPVVSAARQLRDELRREARPPRPEGVGGSGAAAKPERAERPGRGSRPEGAGKPGKPH